MRCQPDSLHPRGVVWAGPGEKIACCGRSSACKGHRLHGPRRKSLTTTAEVPPRWWGRQWAGLNIRPETQMLEKQSSFHLPSWQEMKSWLLLGLFPVLCPALPQGQSFTNHGTPPTVFPTGLPIVSACRSPPCSLVVSVPYSEYSTLWQGLEPLGLELELSRNRWKPFPQKFSPLPKAERGLSSH